MKTIFIATIVAILVIAATTTMTTATSVQASNNDDCREKSALAEIACEGQGVISAYNQGVADGKQAARNGQSNECPQSDSLSGYCIGFGSGWNKITNAQNTLNEDNGNNQDDGEFESSDD